MPYHRFVPVLLAVGGVALLMGALRGTASRPTPEKEEPAPLAFAGLDNAPADPAATALMDQVVARLEEPRLGWVETAVKLRARLADFAFSAEGSYVHAPGRRFRLELRTRSEDAPEHRVREGGGVLLSVSDGPNLWTANRLGAEGWTNVTRLRTAAILDGPESPTSLPQVRNEFLAYQAMRGVELLMRSMHGHLDWVRREEAGRETCLIGKWKPWVVKLLAPPRQPWPEALPRYCRLRLLTAQQWPARIEWWGPRTLNGPDRLLVEMEFRDPVFDRPIPNDRCAKLFAFDPGAAAVDDVTPRVREGLAQRARQLTPAKP